MQTVDKRDVCVVLQVRGIVMNDQNKKDNRLDELFSEYVEDGQIPSESVTNKAKQYMAAQRAAQTAEVPVTVTANGGSQGGNGIKARQAALWAFAAVLLVVAVALVCYFALRRSDSPDLVTGMAPLSSQQLAEESSNFADEPFLVFVDKSSVKEYKTYTLTENVNTYCKRDVAVYYIKFQTADNVDVTLHVEVGGMYWTALDEYKRLPDVKDIDGVKVYCNARKNDGMYYFGYNDFGYNLHVDTHGKAVADGVLTYIVDSLQQSDKNGAVAVSPKR